MRPSSHRPLFLLSVHVLGVWGLLVICGCGRQTKPQLPPQPSGDTLAQVGDESITAQQLTAEMASRHLADEPQAKRKLLDELVHTRVLAQEARREGYDRDPQIIAAYDKLLATRMQEDLRVRAKIGPPEVEAYYNAHPTEFMTPAAIRTAMIFVEAPAQLPADTRTARRATLDEARLKAQQLPPGMTGFGVVATQYSTDQATKLRGGDMGFMVEGAGVQRWEKPVADAAFALNTAGQLSDVITTDRGFYLLKLTAKHTASARPLNSVRAQIEAKLTAEREKQLTADLTKRAADTHLVTIYEDRLGKAHVPTSAVTSK